MSRNRPIIAFYNRVFGEWPDTSGIEGRAPARFARGPEHLETASAVVFHLPTLPSLPAAPKPAGQLWVAWCLESRVTCPLLDDPEVVARIDLTTTHERESDVWHPYFGSGTVPGLLRPPGPRTAGSPVVHLQSNPYDESGRNRYTFELMRRVKVDSFGSVLRNRAEAVPPGWNGRVAVMSRYKFTLAFENSVSRDYVSDKFFDPLTVGSVPVYRGAPEVAELAPAPDCYIDARDFAGAAELGSYLAALDRDDAALARYHAWRERGLSPAFRAHLERLREPPLLRLARKVVERLRGGP